MTLESPESPIRFRRAHATWVRLMLLGGITTFHASSSTGHLQGPWSMIAIIGIGVILCMLPGQRVLVHNKGLRCAGLEIGVEEIVRVFMSRRGVFVVLVSGSGTEKALRLANADGRFEINAADMAMLLAKVWNVESSGGVHGGGEQV